MQNQYAAMLLYQMCVMVRAEHYRIALPRAGLLPGACFIVTAVGLHT